MSYVITTVHVQISLQFLNYYYLIIIFRIINKTFSTKLIYKNGIFLNIKYLNKKMKSKIFFLHLNILYIF